MVRVGPSRAGVLSMDLADPIRVVLQVCEVLEALDVRYLVGGSLASSLYGIPRATQDVDVVAELEPRHVAVLVEKLQGRFFVDEQAVASAVENKATFNIIDREEFFKVDVFAAERGPAADNEMARRQRHELAETGGRAIYLCSPEDIVVHKLYWYRLGDNVSDRQWRDAVNVLKVHGDNLDEKYLREAASLRGVPDLLDKALKERGGVEG